MNYFSVKDQISFIAIIGFVIINCFSIIYLFLPIINLSFTKKNEGSGRGDKE